MEERSSIDVEGFVMTAPRGFGGAGAGPTMPTLPTGFAVAAYPTYAQASAAVEYLVQHDFPVQNVTIVGSDLQLVERVTGKLTLGKVVAGTAASGAWMGLFFGLIMTLFAETKTQLPVILFAVAAGAVFGSVLGLVGYRITKGRKDFTSASQVVARRYNLLCEPRMAEQARNLLAQWQMTQQPLGSAR